MEGFDHPEELCRVSSRLQQSKQVFLTDKGLDKVDEGYIQLASLFTFLQKLPYGDPVGC